MNRLLVGAFGALMLVAMGLFWWQGRAIEAEGLAPPVAPQASTSPQPQALPSADVADMRGPALPTAVKPSDEQRRFARYDINRDLIVTRNEMLSTRVGTFRKLDKDSNNLLTFEEWAFATADKFEGADANGDDRLTPAEFATTRPAKKPKPRCAC
ncbi:hypothetical protein EKN06_02425 [Croceicoccus ponticola]|uniref:EF-hand domain-containing protein n=1 Tax=Croceicoccus ponticola TaxID=2217664 RepID=A0A437H0D6_9SPHN|nr:hypothetical protein [Croceicoccus ponticola]RVQ69085.1 hypothetical protein EKN06_02425 [Croceicoccus ponticola]